MRRRRPRLRRWASRTCRSRTRVCYIVILPVVLCSRFGVVPAEAHQRIEEVASQTFALIEELKQVCSSIVYMVPPSLNYASQAVPVQQERSERVKTVADEIKALKM